MHVTQVCETSSSSHHSQDCLTRRDRDMSSVPTSVPSRRGSAPVCFFEGSISGLRPIPVQSDTLDHIKVSASPSDRCQLASVSLLCASMPSEQGVAALPMLRAVNINDLALDTILYYAADLSYVVLDISLSSALFGTSAHIPIHESSLYVAHLMTAILTLLVIVTVTFLA